MLKSILKLLGLANKIDYKQLLEKGALILDVRTKGEFSSGHIQNAVNIPLDQLKNHLDIVKDRNQPIITCCASGMRSASAKAILKAAGYGQVYNGGGWHSLQRKMK